MSLALVTPPLIKPSEPGLSAAAAAMELRRRGVDAFAVDASLGWYRHALAPELLARTLAEAERMDLRPAALNAFRQALRPQEALRQPTTYADRRRYSSAISHLVNALKLTSVPFLGLQLRVADVDLAHRRPQDSRDLDAVAQAPGPFDAYYREELIPSLRAAGATRVGLSLSFLNQAFATFRLAQVLREEWPETQILLGGPLVACWSAVGASLDGPAFRRFDRILATSSEEELDALAAELGGHPRPEPGILAPDLEGPAWDGYLTPMPIVPVALGRGCYWRRCTFCPDYLHPAWEPSRRDQLGEWLEAVAKRFPGGAMLHLTDSAISPAMLGRIAEVIRERNLPLRWHGFVRMEARFADPGFMDKLSEGGAALLQWGLETASPRLLDLMDKGVSADQARRVLRASAGAGIKNHAYLLFGLPTETEADRETTLNFVREEAGSLHDLNASILNLPRRSPMHDAPERYGITRLSAFGHNTDLSLYADFRCGDSHPRLEARRWIAARFQKDPSVKRILGDLNGPFKENHSCFLPH